MFPGFSPDLFADSNFKEDSVRELVIVPILNRLGYGPSGNPHVVRSNSLKHPFIRVGTRNHQVTTIPDYTILYDSRPVFVLDAKGPCEDISKNEHVQQAYSYAIHPEIKCREFGLCNGRRLMTFDIDKRTPNLDLSFDEFDTQWTEIEKYLSIRYLIKPHLRKFFPDFGLRLQRMGIGNGSAIHLPGVRLNMFGRVSDELMTASSNCTLADVEHCVSFDFPTAMLREIIRGLPIQLQELFCDALARHPFQAAAGLVVEVDLAVQLGEETKGMEESFIPLVIKAVHEARFNPEEVVNDKDDIPAHFFQLRKAFKIQSKSEI